jgi:hypothetical protein
VKRPVMLAWLMPSILTGCAGSESGTGAARVAPIERKAPGYALPRGPSEDHPAADLLEWAADNLRGWRSVFLEGGTAKSHEVDIDHDGRPELFVWSRGSMGMAGGAYLVFRFDDRGYRFIGDLASGPYRPLPLGTDGRPRIATYWRHNAEEGSILIYANDGRKFVCLSGEVVFSRDDGSEEPDERRFRELFGDYAFRQGHTLRFYHDDRRAPREVFTDMPAWISKHLWMGTRPAEVEARMKRHDIDIDRDGVAEVLVWSPGASKRAPVLCEAFRRADGGYVYLGCLRLGTYEVLAPTPDGKPRIASWFCLPEGWGSLVVYTFDAQGFLRLSSELLGPDDGKSREDEARLREVFAAGAFRRGERVDCPRLREPD